MVREAKANLSFGIYRQGKSYQVEESDQRVQALVGAGYLSYPQPAEVQEDDRADNGDLGAVPSGDVAATEAAQEPVAGVNDGQGEDEPGG